MPTNGGFNPPPAPGGLSRNEKLGAGGGILAFLLAAVVIVAALLADDPQDKPPRRVAAAVATATVAPARTAAATPSATSSPTSTPTRTPSPTPTPSPKATPAATQHVADQKGTTQPAATPAPKVRFSAARSYCEQLPITDGNTVELLTQGTLVKFVVYLKNSGNEAARGGTIAPTRIYADGKEVLSPFKDTMIDIDVPADGRWHVYWNKYTVGPGHVVEECRARIDLPGLVGGDTRAVRVIS